MENLIHEKADHIRDVIRYLKKFKDALVIIYLDDLLMDNPNFQNHIKDICLIHDSGLKVILVPGAAKRINEILKNASIPWTIHNNCRITGPEALPLIKMAAFDVSNQIMTALASEKKTAIIGNWVRARTKGIIDGFDYGTSGEIDKLQIDAIKTILDNDFIPIFPCIGWSSAGKPYNISSIELAQQIAIHLKADKLFYLTPDADINNRNYTIPETIGLAPDGTVPAMNVEEVDMFLRANEKDCVSRETNGRLPKLLDLAKAACKEGVSRIHIINGNIDGTIPCEIFSDFGSGTMIYTSDYGKIRDMNHEDIGDVLNLMSPFIQKGILLPRTKESMNSQFQNYIVYELDGSIKACAALIEYPDGKMEIAGVAVDKSCSSMGIGPKLIEFLVKRAKDRNASTVFLLTTQTSDWFENLGFIPADISILPKERKAKWTPARGSKVLIAGKI